MNIEELIEAEVDQLYEKMKSECKTYGELEKKISTHSREKSWNGNDIEKLISDKIKRRYQEEIQKISLLPIEGSKN